MERNLVQSLPSVGRTNQAAPTRPGVVRLFLASLLGPLVLAVMLTASQAGIGLGWLMHEPGIVVLLFAWTVIPFALGLRFRRWLWPLVCFVGPWLAAIILVPLSARIVQAFGVSITSTWLPAVADVLGLACAFNVAAGAGGVAVGQIWRWLRARGKTQSTADGTTLHP